MNPSVEQSAAEVTKLQSLGAAAEVANVGTPRRSIVANASWTLIGNITYAGCQALWMILLGPRFVPLASSGDFYLALTIATPLLAFSGLALRSVLATDTRGEFNFTEYMTLRLIMTTLSLVLIVMIPAIGMLLGFVSVSTLLVISAVGLAKSIETISDMIFGKFQIHERLDLIGLSLTLKGALSIVGLGLGAILTHSALGAALGLVGAWIIVLLAYDLPRLFSIFSHQATSLSIAGYMAAYQERTRAAHRLGPRIWQLFKRSAPVGFSYGIYMLNPNIVMYFTRAYLGAELFSVFAILQQLTTPGSYITNSIGMAITPRLARAYADDRRPEFKHVLLLSILCVLLIGAAGVGFVVVVGHWFLNLLFGPKVAQFNDILAWTIAVATILNVASLLGFASTATRTFHRFAIPYSVVSLIALATSAIFVPRWGMYGALLAFGAINVAAAIAFSTIILWARFDRRRPLDLKNSNAATTSVCG